MHHRLLAIAFLLLATLTTGGCAASRSSGPADYAAPMPSGLRVAYTDAGPRDATALIFIHGWASDRTVWHNQLDALAAEYRVITIDLPGHGQSDAPEDVEYSMKLLATGVRTVMDDAAVDQAILIGHSNGVPVIRTFQLLFPWRVEGLVGVDGAFVRVFAASMAAPIMSQLQSDTYVQFIESMMPQMFPYTPEEDQASITATAISTPQHVLIGTFEAALADDAFPDDPIEKPVLAVVAHEAPFWTDAYFEQVVAIAPMTQIIRMQRAGHFLMLDRPETFNEVLIEWIERGGEMVR
ncbi:MAG: alpha/beta hydrolase [Planctomycetota bacterium]